MGDRALIDELYEADPREFVAARDRLAKQLRAEGERQEAAKVKALRRPSVAAWALNHVARHRPAAVRDLLDAGERARVAQDEVLGGADREALRAALAERRHALHVVVDAAREFLEESGRGADAATREIESALQGPYDDAFVETLKRGALSDVDAGSDDQLSSLLSASVLDASGPAEEAPRPSKADEARRKKLTAEVERLDAELGDASARVEDTEKRVAVLERELRDAERERDDARRAHERAANALDRAREKLDRVN